MAAGQDDIVIDAKRDRLVITASSLGTVFEWYDFFIFGSLAPVISKVFFAGLDPTAALISARQQRDDEDEEAHHH